MNKVLCLYHGDFDGWASAAIVKNFYKVCYPKYDFIFEEMSYGKKIPFNLIDKDTAVYMVDFSPENQELLDKLVSYSPYFFLIDHHKTVGEKLDLTGIAGSYNTTKAACQLTWEFFYPEVSIPIGLQFFADFDIWKKRSEDYWENFVIPFQYGSEILVTSAKDPQMWEILSQQDLIDKTLAQGRIIQSYLKNNNKRAMKASFDVTLDGLKLLACCGVLGSTAFESKWDPKKYDGMLAYFHKRDKFKCSMYTDKDIDLSVTAKKYDGGGHAKACGFIVKHDQIPWKVLSKPKVSLTKRI